MSGSESSSSDHERRLDEAIASYLKMKAEGQAPERDQWLAKNPDLAVDLAEFLDDVSHLKGALGNEVNQTQGRQAGIATAGRFRQEERLGEGGKDEVADGTRDTNNVLQLAANNSLNEQAGDEPKRFGPYIVLRPLGAGTFGAVYKAQHESTGSVVAVKMLKSRWARDPECGDVMRRQFAEEARMMLQFDHPRIVKVISLDERAEPPYFVQEYIDGDTLHSRLQLSRPTIQEAIEYAIQIADGLAHIHSRSRWHRDLKPANILLDRENGVHLADFGLALDDAQRWRSSQGQVGTFPYMAPEQIQGATHRLNARCDLWALGVILYEMLTGKRPFHGVNRQQLSDEILERTPAAPRELNQEIPRELNRLCMQCLSKRDADRPHAAADLRDDLRQLLERLQTGEGSSSTVASSSGAASSSAKKPHSASPPLEHPIPTLRRFTADQAELYLRLMPKSFSNAEELPELIAYWMERIGRTELDDAFTVGVMVGVSGCGKSSLLEAGLIPNLPVHVVPILVEASDTETELRVLNKLHKALPQADAERQWTLSDWAFRLRSGSLLPPGKKVLLILDQFEQWLNAHGGEASNPLLEALHQCDGQHLQAIVCVREGFHATLMRFVQLLNLHLDDHHNYATAHRFTPDHARYVLTQFGRGLKRVDEPLSEPQRAFIDATIAGLAESDRGVVCVRLVVLALVMQDRPWTVAELEKLGGLDGIGCQFLVDCFEGRTASEQYRRYLPAAMRILAELLPAEGLEIKDVRSYDQLLVASELDKLQFDDLLNILVRKLFLLTPIEQIALSRSSRSSSSSSSSSSLPPPASSLFLQLTHDFLVPSIREWLSRKLHETKAGRAQLRLQELTAGWTSKPQNRNLPSLWEWLTIRRWTDRQKWNACEQTVMRRAGRVHATRTGLFASAVVMLTALGLAFRGQLEAQKERSHVESWVAQLITAEPARVPEIVRQLDAAPELARELIAPLLKSEGNTIDQKRSKLHAQLAIVGRDASLVDPLVEELLSNKVAYLGPIREQLRPYAGELKEKLRAILRDDKAETNRRFRAAVALADYIPESEVASWTEQDLQFVAGQLVVENAEFQPLLRENLRPISERLLADLEKIFGNARSTDAQRLSTANAFADFAASDIPKLSQLLTVATPAQYAVLYPLVAASPTASTVEDIGKIAATLPPVELGSVERVLYGQHRANAAVTLLRLGERERVLPVFDMTDDPEALTQFIFRCRDRGVRVEELLDCLRLVSDTPGVRHPRNTRYALLLALGEYALDEIPESQREPLLRQLGDWYRNDPSSGVHGASGWLLRHWGQHEVVRQVDQTAVPYAADREWFTLAITVTPTPLPKPKEEPTEDNAAAAPAAKTEPTSEAAESKDEATEKQDESASPESPPEEATPEPPAEPLTPQTFYYTFIVFPAGDSQIGSFGDEPDRSKNEVRHSVTLTKPFALLDREITMEELIAFSPEYTGFMQQFDAKPEDAGFGSHWYDSASFCRWLSLQSGLSESDQSYVDPESLDKEQYPREPNPEAHVFPRNWPLELGRRGFRLPTESEWEVASRAGVRTAYGYGSDVALLGQFGWFTENSGKHSHPPRELRPSHRGLFDMHGNLLEWTHDWSGHFSESAVTDSLGVKEGSFRVSRGGSWDGPAAICRSVSRRNDAPLGRAADYGFRLALSSPPRVSSPAEQDQVAEPAGGGTEGVSAEQPHGDAVAQCRTIVPNRFFFIKRMGTISPHWLHYDEGAAGSARSLPTFPCSVLRFDAWRPLPATRAIPSQSSANTVDDRSFYSDDLSDGLGCGASSQ